MLLVSLLYTGVSLFAGVELIRYSFADDEDEPSDAADEGELVRPPEARAQEEPDAFEMIDGSFGLSAGALVLSVMGRVIPLARVVSVPLLILGVVPSARAAWTNLRTNKTLDYTGVATIGTALEIALGYTTLAAVGWVVFTGGKRLQMLSRHKVERQVGDAFADMDEHVWVVRDGAELQMPIGDLSLDDLIIVRAGDPMPVDGVIIEGTVAIDERALTGESRPSERGAGEQVFAATLILSGWAHVRPHRTGADTLAGRVEELMLRAESYEQRLRDRAELEAEHSVRPTVIMMGVGAVTGGPVAVLTGFWSNATELSWFGLPYSVMNTVEEAARATILVKDGRSLGELSRVDTVVFDKTGTLTLDSYELASVHAYLGHSEGELLSAAASLEQRQQHPIARAIVAAANRAGVEVETPDELNAAVGLGLSASLRGVDVVLGSPRLMSARGIDVAVAGDIAAQIEHRGHSAIYLAFDGRCVGTLELGPQLRPEASAVLDRLRARGLDLMLVSGDAPAPCAALARQLGIETCHAEMLPEDKARIISELQARGRRVCFVGDGINDGLALKTANVSVSMTGASSLAIDNAQILMQSGSLERLDDLFALAKRFEREQAAIAGIARGVTVASGLGFLILGLELPMVVWLYLAAAGTTLFVSSLPRMRGLKRAEVRPHRLALASGVRNKASTRQGPCGQVVVTPLPSPLQV